MNVFLGPNGAGKTTILEAVSVCSTLTTVRTGPMSTLLRHSCTDGGVAVETEESELRVKFSPRRTEVAVNGNNTTSRNFLGRLSSVLFAPEDLDIVTGDPAQRRRMLDELIIQSRPGFRRTRSDYDRSVRQRNAALRVGDSESARLYNESVATTGAEIICARHALCEQLAVTVPKLYSELADSGTLEVSYQPRIEETDFDHASVTEKMNHLLNRDLQIELERKSTRWGPHRDELPICLDSHDLRVFGSRGEQRTASLALKLAGLEILPSAVLLLDDVLSELDPDRRSKVLQLAGERQVLLTATDSAALMDDVGNPKVFQIDEGRVVEV